MHICKWCCCQRSSLIAADGSRASTFGGSQIVCPMSMCNMLAYMHQYCHPQARARRGLIWVIALGQAWHFLDAHNQQRHMRFSHECGQHCMPASNCTMQGCASITHCGDVLCQCANYFAHSPLTCTYLTVQPRTLKYTAPLPSSRSHSSLHTLGSFPLCPSAAASAALLSAC